MAQPYRTNGTVEAMHGLVLFVAVGGIVFLGMVGFVSGYAKGGHGLRRDDRLPSARLASTSGYALARITPAETPAPRVASPIHRVSVAPVAAPDIAPPVDVAAAQVAADPAPVDISAAAEDAPAIAPLPPIANPT